jgi:hypothetical protein
MLGRKYKVLEILFLIDAIICVISILVLAFFCAVLPRTNIAKYFYLLFGITMIPIGIDGILDGYVWYEYIWFFIFSAVGIIVGIRLIVVNRFRTKEEQKEFDRNFGEMARRSGKRKMPKMFWKMRK